MTLQQGTSFSLSLKDMHAIGTNAILTPAPATFVCSLNQNLVNVLKHADKVVICGEALSHCVNYTVRDLVEAWPADRIADLILLTDCASPVPGFESSGEDFLTDMAAKGLTLTKSTDFQM